MVVDTANNTGIHEEPRIKTPMFMLALNVDVHSVAADSMSTSMGTTSVAVSAGLSHRFGRGWEIV